MNRRILALAFVLTSAGACDSNEKSSKPPDSDASVSGGGRSSGGGAGGSVSSSAGGKTSTGSGGKSPNAGGSQNSSSGGSTSNPLPGGDATAPDASSTSNPPPPMDAGGGAPLGGPSRCPGGFLVCDGFEGNALDAKTWAPYGSAGIFSTAIDATQLPARGKSSLKFHILDPNAGEVYAMMQLAVPLPKTALYLRYFFFYPSAAKDIRGWVGKLDGPSGGVWLSLDGGSGVFAPEAMGNILTPPTSKQGSSYKLPFDKWVCLEWQVQPGTTGKGDGRFRLLADGVDTGLDMSGFVAAPFDTLWTGFNPVAPKIQFDFWMDEYVVSDKPIGCNR